MMGESGATGTRSAQDVLQRLTRKGRIENVEGLSGDEHERRRELVGLRSHPSGCAVTSLPAQP